MALSANEKLEMINNAKEKLKKDGGSSDVIFKNATIWFKNFDGSRDRNGKRTFNILLKSDNYDAFDDDYIQELADQGWNIKFSNRLNDDGEPLYVTIPVEIRFDRYPPEVVVISRGKRVDLNEDTIGELQGASIDKINLRIGPRVWFDDKTETCKVKAYLRKMHVYLRDMHDELDDELNAAIGDGSVDDLPFDIDE